MSTEEVSTTDERICSSNGWKLFNLLYLLFYFTAWLFQRPGTTDVVAILIALVVFLPLFFDAYEDATTRVIPHILAMELLCWALTPFNGIAGVFHVYACVQAGYQRPAQRALLLIATLNLAFVAFALLTDYAWPAVVFSVLISVLTGIACMASAASIEREALQQRSRVREQQEARIAERERIAHDLHDLLGHTLTMVALKSEVADKLIDVDPGRARQEIREVAEASRTALKDIRAAVYDMTVTTVDAEIALARRALDAAGVSLDVRNTVPPLSPPAGKALGLTIREAATNIVRHAGARHAVIDFEQRGEALCMTVSDDGRGATQPSEGSGLTGLRKRITELGGRTEIESQGGLQIRVILPMDANLAGAPS
ncbi:MAG: sensor histidine kinase [Pseudomonadota bacterium]